MAPHTLLCVPSNPSGKISSQSSCSPERAQHAHHASQTRRSRRDTRTRLSGGDGTPGAAQRRGDARLERGAGVRCAAAPLLERVVQERLQRGGAGAQAAAGEPRQGGGQRWPADGERARQGRWGAERAITSPPLRRALPRGLALAPLQESRRARPQPATAAASDLPCHELPPLTSQVRLPVDALGALTHASPPAPSAGCDRHAGAHPGGASAPRAERARWRPRPRGQAAARLPADGRHGQR